MRDLIDNPLKGLEGQPIESPQLNADDDLRHLSDSQLLDMYLNDRSQEAMAQIIERYGGLVYSVASRVLDRTEDREDVFQATFAILCVSANKIKKSSSLGSYLYGVAHRTAKRLRVKAAREQGLVNPMDTAHLDAFPCTKPDSLRDEGNSDAYDLFALEQAILQLPESLRESFIEHHLLGQSVPSIAQRMQLSVSAVESRIKRGKQKLKSLLEKRGLKFSSAMLVSLSVVEPMQSSQASDRCVLETQGQSRIYHPSEFNLKQFDHLTVHGHLIHEEMIMAATRKKWLLAASALGSSGLLLAGGAIQLPAMLSESIATPLVAQETTSDDDPSGGTAEKVETAKAPETVRHEGFDDDGFGDDQGDFKFSQSGPNPVSEKISEVQATEALRDKLRSTQMQPNFTGVPLSDVLDGIADEQGFDIIINRRALEEEGVPIDVMVDLDLNYPVSLRTCLDLILEPLNLTYCYKDGVLIVTSANSEAHTLRAYNVNKILGGDQVFKPSFYDGLIGVIECAVKHDDWEVNGGTATINFLGRVLIVNASERTHLALEKFFAMLKDQDLDAITSHDGLNQLRRTRRPPVNNGMGGMGMGGMGAGVSGVNGATAVPVQNSDVPTKPVP